MKLTSISMLWYLIGKLRHNTSKVQGEGRQAFSLDSAIRISSTVIRRVLKPGSYLQQARIKSATEGHIKDRLLLRIDKHEEESPRHEAQPVKESLVGFVGGSSLRGYEHTNNLPGLPSLLWVTYFS